MAFDKEKIRKSLAAKFAKVNDGGKATDNVAAAIAEAMAEAVADLEVEVTVKASVAEVPTTINTTAKGGVK